MALIIKNQDVEKLLDEVGIVTIPFTESHFRAAVNAWIKYGKGRHAAALNYG